MINVTIIDPDLDWGSNTIYMYTFEKCAFIRSEDFERINADPALIIKTDNLKIEIITFPGIGLYDYEFINNGKNYKFQFNVIEKKNSSCSIL